MTSKTTDIEKSNLKPPSFGKLGNLGFQLVGFKVLFLTRRCANWDRADSWLNFEI